MRVVVSGTTHGLADAQAFVRRLADDDAGTSPAAPGFLRGRDVIVTRAPLRVGLFGGLVNGTGARVLHWPLGPGVLVALQRHPDRTLRVLQSTTGRQRVIARLELPLNFLEASGEVVAPSVARDYFARYEDRRWATRVVGAVITLMRERRVRFREGLTLLVEASTPEDEALGAHAALSVATLRALAAAASISLDAQDAGRFCRMVELSLVTAAFPWSDCLATARASAGSLLAVTAAAGVPADVVDWPADLALWGLRIGTPSQEVARLRARLQTAALMAYRIAADVAGHRVRMRGPRQATVDDPRWRGRLAAIPIGEFANAVVPNLPETLDGEAFLARYRALTTGGAHVEPATTYRVRAAAQHVVAEQDRVRQFEYLLDAAHGDARMADLAELLAESLASHAALGLADAGLCRAVDALIGNFRASGGIGLTVVAGGEGGALAAVGRSDAGTAVSRLGSDLEGLLGAPVTVLGGTSPGAYRFGSVRLRGS